MQVYSQIWKSVISEQSSVIRIMFLFNEVEQKCTIISLITAHGTYDQNNCQVFLSLILSYETVSDLSFFSSWTEVDV